MTIQRRGVQNPFEQQPEQQRFQGISVNPASINRTEFQVEQNTSAFDIVKGLVDFAGVAGEAYAARLDKQVEADKIIQTQRATLGLTPTPDATEGGYKAHMAVSVKNKTLKAQAKLNGLARENYSEDEWEEIIRDTYAEVDTQLSEEYPDYDNYEEIQKLTTLSLAEIMPQITAEREAAKFEHEIQGRMQDEQDVLLSEISLTQDADALLKRFEERTSAMKLTQSQKEAILTEIALNSDSETAIELTKRFKGERGSTLYERKGQLQRKAQEIANDKNSINAGELGLEVSRFQEDFLSGEFTEEEAVRIIERRNKETEGRFMSQAASTALFNKVSAERAKRHRQQAIMQGVLGDRPMIPGAEKSEISGAIEAQYSQYLQAGIREIEKSVPEGDRAKAIGALQARATQMFGDISARQGVALDSWTAGFDYLANTNVSAVVDISQGVTIEELPERLQANLQTMMQMSPVSLGFYMDNLGARERDILRHTMDLVDMGVEPAQALMRGQLADQNKVPRSPAQIEKAVMQTRKAVDSGIFNKDIPSNLRPYYEAEIRKKLSSYPDPTSERAQKEIKAYFDNQWTNVGGGVRVKGSPRRLTELTGISDSSDLKLGFDGLMEGYRDRIAPILDGTPWTFKDLIPSVDPDAGTITFVTPDTNPVMSEVPLTNLQTLYIVHKNRLAKKLAERNLESLNRATLGGM